MKLKESQLNIQGLVSTIKDTNPYTAIVEAINNGIYSIQQTGKADGLIRIELVRDNAPLSLIMKDKEADDRSLPDITSVIITDNGIGFDDKNINSFNEAYTRNKVSVGGKGFGRFVYLKHFSEVVYESVHSSEGNFIQRNFSLGKVNQIVYGFKETEAHASESGTRLTLSKIKNGKMDKRSATVARKILEKILIQFVRRDMKCPRILIVDDYEEAEYDLNQNIGDTGYAEIELVNEQYFKVGSGSKAKDFELHVFKIWFPNNAKSKISLASHYLEVEDEPLEQYVNEFEEDLIGDFEGKNGEKSSHFVIKAYVTGKYLDDHVDRERVKFAFNETGDVAYPIGSRDIGMAAAVIVKSLFKDHFNVQRERKVRRLNAVVGNRTWLQSVADDYNLDNIKPNATENELMFALEIAKIKKDNELELSAENIVKSPANQLADDMTQKLIKNISKSNKEDLAKYVTKRKVVIDIFKKSLEHNKDTGNYEHEKVVHDIIYPMHTNSEEVGLDFQNLWMLDERFNFSHYVSSDNQMGSGNPDRPDLFIFHHQVAFRSGEELHNPITIVEFKRPGREDFIGKDNKENPITQVVRYVREIKNSKYKTPKNRPIHTDQNTQFYAYIIIDFSSNVKDWLEFDEQFTPMPDGLGYYSWLSNLNLYIEVLSWDKVIKDAEVRNRIFIDKLGLS